MNEEDVIFNLIKKDCEKGGAVPETRVFKMAQLLNINQEKYQKAKERLIETGKVSIQGNCFSLS